MYQVLTLKSRIRVPPNLFGAKIEESVEQAISDNYAGVLDSKHGLFLSLVSVESIGDGVIIPGDGAIYYDCNFKLLSYNPVVQELVEGEVTEITDFGAFAKIGPIEGLIHMSQIMDEFVSYSKSGSWSGKDSKRSLKSGDKIKARVIAVSMKNLQTAKIGLTLRQPGLGAQSWLKKTKKTKKVVKAE